MEAQMPAGALEEERKADFLREELENFREIARVLMPSPGEVPRLPGLQIDGISLPLRDVVGGDHTIYLDFNSRFDLDARIRKAGAEGRLEVAARLELNRQRAGILLADVAGHRITDAAMAAMLHQAFLVGCSYELEMFGEVTTHLFERLKTRFCQSSAVNKFFTLVYGEIWTSGRFRFITAGHLPPYRFHPEKGRLEALLPATRGSLTPVGMFGSSQDIDWRRLTAGSIRDERFVVQECLPLEDGEILVLCTDGLAEHDDGRFFARGLPDLLASGAQLPVGTLCAAIRQALRDGPPPADDITFVLIRKEPAPRA